MDNHAAVKIEGLTKNFAMDDSKVQAVRSVSFEIRDGAFFTLLGPSGCGKSTTLRCVAGLEYPDDGDVYIGDELVVSRLRNVFVPPYQRDIGMVFQSYAIWPHMSVFENVAFPLTQMKVKVPKRAIRDKVLRVLELVQLQGLENRPSPLLSGGQQQRLALARALVGEPKLLLLDEPLSNLDAKLREEMRMELVELTRRLHITTLYVTHDQLEALAMSDVVAIMRNGKIEQIGNPKDAYMSPQTRFAAEFVGTTNIIEGQILGKSSSAPVSVQTIHGPLHCDVPGDFHEGDNVIITLRPENIGIVKEHPGQPLDFSGIVLEGKVEIAAFMGDFLDCRIRVKDQPFRVKVHPSFSLTIGEMVYLRVPKESCTVLLTR
ncbi:MAG TPA: ABC transporter ATP-binding protein [Candidatus Binatia bacterium]|jgi:iron(III) transport system ATP-binding protein